MKKFIFVITIACLLNFSIVFARPVRVIYKQDGTISIIYPAQNSKKSTETEKEWLARVLDKATPKGLAWEDIDSSELPKDRTYRDIWEKEKGKPFKIDNDKKKNFDNEKLIEEEIKKTSKQNAIEKLKSEGKLQEDY